MMYFSQRKAMYAVKINAFRSGNGEEFTSHVVEEFHASSVSNHEVSPAYSLEEDRVAERVNRTTFGQAN